ncbi:MAG: flagellar export chaperone FlgN [Candidatus Wallbacteria bacterium]|nr:flagellar export chaperone FlgN [Candidatus Wallbacteria bacterium]
MISNEENLAALKSGILDSLRAEYSKYREFEALLVRKEKAVLEDNVDGLKELNIVEIKLQEEIRALEVKREEGLSEFATCAGLKEKVNFRNVFSEELEDEACFLAGFQHLLRTVQERNERVTTLITYLLRFNQVLAKSISDGLNELTYEKDGSQARRQGFNLLNLRA